jgi:murein DD-endopeptidase MepM/ murein hydrolase activator NlpD
MRNWLRTPRPVLIAAVLLLAVPALAKAIRWKVRWQPQRIVNGSPLLLRVQTSAKLKSLSATWLGHDVYFSWDETQHDWYGIAGTSLETAPGVYTLRLSAELQAGGGPDPLIFNQPVKVQHATYPNASVTVDHKFTEPNPAELEQIHQDKTTKQEAFSRFTPAREWSGDFRQPVVARISDVFGATRTFNGKVQSTHEGLDFAVPAGTPVAAINRGTVVLARPLFFEGNFVVIDHGQGLLTLYLHLSHIGVKEGEQVSSGQEIGLSGGTGRATGPHLHLAVRWQGIYVDPATLLSLNLP